MPHKAVAVCLCLFAWTLSVRPSLAGVSVTETGTTMTIRLDGADAERKIRPPEAFGTWIAPPVKSRASMSTGPTGNQIVTMNRPPWGTLDLGGDCPAVFGGGRTGAVIVNAPGSGCVIHFAQRPWLAPGFLPAAAAALALSILCALAPCRRGALSAMAGHAATGIAVSPHPSMALAAATGCFLVSAVCVKLFSENREYVFLYVPTTLVSLALLDPLVNMVAVGCQVSAGGVFAIGLSLFAGGIFTLEN